jgi:UDP-perosamine 4-acetyltransferase
VNLRSLGAIAVVGYNWDVQSPSPRRVLLIGAGGHAKVCLEALRDMAEIEVVGAVSSDGSGAAGLEVPVLGTQGDLEKITQSRSVTTICVAVGDNLTRQRIVLDITESGYSITQAISRYAMVSTTALISPGAQLLAGSVVNASTKIGDGAIVNTSASVDHDCQIGEYVHVGPGATIGGDVTIGQAALIGLGARVVSGLTIGDGAVVGAGSVVISDVPPGAKVVGVPARQIDADGTASSRR